jgi:hypothetical protein
MIEENVLNLSLCFSIKLTYEVKKILENEFDIIGIHAFAFKHTCYEETHLFFSFCHTLLWMHLAVLILSRYRVEKLILR